MLDALRQPWPWWVAGPLIGAIAAALLAVGNRHFGVSSNLRHLCALAAPRRVEYFRYDWRRLGLWNLTFLAGILAGGWIAGRWLPGPPEVALAADTRAALAELGLRDFTGLVPSELISWASARRARGLLLLLGGGALVGFGTAYAGGCTSGHGILGLATFQRASLLAVAGFFAGGLAATHLLLPLLR